MTSRTAPGRHSHVVTVVAPRATGAGSSTLPLNLAAWLGLRLRGTGNRVCFIDANVTMADAGRYLNYYSPNVVDLLRDPATIHPDRIVGHLLHKPELNLHVLLGPPTPELANPLAFTGCRYTEILDALRPNFDYIIIDAPGTDPYDGLLREFALPHADQVLAVTRADGRSLDAARDWLNRSGVPADRAGIAVIRAGDSPTLPGARLTRQAGTWPVWSEIPDFKPWQSASRTGQLIVTKNYREINVAFDALAGKIVAGYISMPSLVDPAKTATVRSRLARRVRQLIRLIRLIRRSGGTIR